MSNTKLVDKKSGFDSVSLKPKTDKVYVPPFKRNKKEKAYVARLDKGKSSDVDVEISKLVSNSKAMNTIFNAVFMEEFKRISNVEVAYTAWNILQTVHEVIKAVKINKLQQLTSRFEIIRMFDDECFDEFMLN